MERNRKVGQRIIMFGVMVQAVEKIEDSAASNTTEKQKKKDVLEGRSTTREEDTGIISILVDNISMVDYLSIYNFIRKKEVIKKE